MGGIIKQHERILIHLVNDEEWEIDGSGRIWRLKIRRGDKCNGGIRLLNCERRRVEHRLTSGYLQVRASINGIRYNGLAHRLVYQYFFGDIPDGYEINHENGIKDDNHPNNLSIVTPSANITHAHKTGLIDQYGQSNPAAKLTDNEVVQIRLAYHNGGYTMDALAKKYGVRVQSISRIITGKRRAKQGGPISTHDHRPEAMVRGENGQLVPRYAGAAE